MFVILKQAGIPIDTTLFGGNTGLDLAVVPNTNDSVVNVAYEVDNITTGALTVEVYANRMAPKILANEPLPGAQADSSYFLMTGRGTLTSADGVYKGTVNVVRDVAKLRINISKHPLCLPTDLGIVYDGIKVQVLDMANQTSLFQNRGEATGLSGFTYISCTERTGTTGPLRLRRSATFSPAAGGQIDSLYLNENYRNAGDYPVGTRTRIKVTIPTSSASEGNKTDSYEYDIYTDGSYDIKRNTIYTLDIKVRGQSLEPLINLSVLPWNDVPVDGSIHGTYLTLDNSEIVFNANTGVAVINFCSDAQAIYLDFDEFNANNGGITVGNQIKPIGIDTIPTLPPAGYESGQILLDQQHCGSFGFKLDPAYFGSSGYGNIKFSGKICIKAGNIVKCLTFPARRVYDAHFIVGDELFAGEKYTSAQVSITDGTGFWLEVSPNKLYTSAATQNWANATETTIYLHLNENLSGAPRSGSVTVISNGVEKILHITQLPAIHVGRFGLWNETTQDNYKLDRALFTEQLYEYTEWPQYKTVADEILPTYNFIYNGFYAAKGNSFDASKYNNGSFDYKSTSFQASNYCAYKNRGTNPDGTLKSDGSDIKWYLPSQAQLMGMWITYESYKGLTTSNFPVGVSDTVSYWSSTGNSLYKKEAQYLNFGYGNVGHYFKTN
ncbi:MAG: hypothetical protein LBT42_05500, partial [Tannerella sp.]|nr:hypothetical protein [Tannerella sp.]